MTFVNVKGDPVTSWKQVYRPVAPGLYDKEMIRDRALMIGGDLGQSICFFFGQYSVHLFFS